MGMKVGINGFGRIGRLVLRLGSERPDIEFVGINSHSQTPDYMAYLLKYDSVHGRFQGEVSWEGDDLIVNGRRIRVFHCEEPGEIPWGSVGAEYIIESTGKFTTAEKMKGHLDGGAKKVLLTAPSKDDTPMFVMGVNNTSYDKSMDFVSNASCTTNCIIPVIKLLDDAYGIESGTVTTIHSAMHDQQVIDAYHPDLRRTRAASQSIIPVDTKLAAGITRFFPQFNDRFEAIAVRVPTINVTAIDLSVTVKKPVKANEVNLLLQKAAQGAFHGIVDYTELPLVSVDFNHDPHSAIVDGTQTRVSGAHLIKTLVWCDNEWGFANRMLDTTLAMATVAFR